MHKKVPEKYVEPLTLIMNRAGRIREEITDLSKSLVSIAHELKHREQMKLSDICDSLIYIPLETKKESLLGGVSKVKVDGDDVFINYYWGLYHFKINGDFVGQIGRKGRGPGEYICTGFCLNKKDKNIYY